MQEFADRTQGHQGRLPSLDDAPCSTLRPAEVTKLTRAFGQDDDLALKPNGTGGTAFSPIFRYCRDHDIDPACAVILTDLYCDDFGAAPAYPVLWVSTGAKGPTPFGTVTMLRGAILGKSVAATSTWPASGSTCATGMANFEMAAIGEHHQQNRAATGAMASGLRC